MLTIRVPASTANLGAGFDAMGMALDVFNVLEIEPAGALDIQADSPLVPRGEDNLIWQSMLHTFRVAGRPPIPVRLRQRDAIPMTRGMGSSSACIVGGVVAANALMGGPLDEAQLCDLVVRMEGHPDNVLPALLGGLVVAAVEEEGAVRYARLTPHPRFAYRVLTPDYPLATAKARAVLPPHYTRAEATYNLGRALLMAASLEHGLADNLAAAAQDCIHQPYRKTLIPGFDRIGAAAYEAGALSMTLSGAGPSLFLILDGEPPDFDARMAQALSGVPGHWDILAVHPHMQGAVVEGA
jgi:homoserine kinase